MGLALEGAAVGGAVGFVIGSSRTCVTECARLEAVEGLEADHAEVAQAVHKGQIGCTVTGAMVGALLTKTLVDHQKAQNH